MPYITGALGEKSGIAVRMTTIPVSMILMIACTFANRMIKPKEECKKESATA